MKKINLSIRGFTLVELMVTIAIMALLTGIITANLTSSRKKARDAKRISDIGQIQLALELFFDRCNFYPAVTGSGLTQTIGTSGPNTSCTTSSGSTITINTFLSPIPTPTTGTTQTVYNYGINAAATDYVLKARLEDYSEVLKDDFDSTQYSIACGTASNGEGNSERDYCVTSQ